MKVGNRVTVVPLPADHPQKRCEGKRGEVVQIGPGEVPQPAGISDPTLVLVDGQLVNGKREGMMDFREWMKPEDLEVG